MRQVTPIDNSLGRNLAMWLGPFLEQFWQDDVFGEHRPEEHYRAALRFLLGCKLAARFGDDPRLSFLGGPSDTPALSTALKVIAEKAPLWERIAPEPGFNSFLNLLATWRAILGRADNPEEVVLGALVIPFRFRDPQCLNRFSGSCVSQLRRLGDWLSLGFILVHRWTDENHPGPDLRLDPLSMALAAPYFACPPERHLMASVFAAAPRVSHRADERLIDPCTCEGAYVWAHCYPEKYPNEWAELEEATNADQNGPGIASLVDFYRHRFGHCPPGEWRSSLTSVVEDFIRQTVPEAHLPGCCQGPATFRASIDFAVWASLIESHLLALKD